MAFVFTQGNYSISSHCCLRTDRSITLLFLLTIKQSLFLMWLLCIVKTHAKATFVDILCLISLAKLYVNSVNYIFARLFYAGNNNHENNLIAALLKWVFLQLQAAVEVFAKRVWENFSRFWFHTLSRNINTALSCVNKVYISGEMIYIERRYIHNTCIYYIWCAGNYVHWG